VKTVRKTISLPAHLADDLDREARERGMSFSALIAEKATAPRRKLSWAGSISDDPDLSLKVEEILKRSLQKTP
jgi:hypothetical protein